MPARSQKTPIVLFTSVTFLFYFLPLVVVGYFLLPSIRLRNTFLLLSSLVFYFWGEPWFVLVMLLSIGVNYVAGLLIDGTTGRARRIWVATAIALNLTLLATFKYADFLTANLNLLLAPLGVAMPLPGIALPLGISFFTFQAISYLIDVHRQHVPAERNPLDLAMYIAMFPQLVAGPIVRFETVAREIHQRRSTLGRISTGTRIFIIGLAQKALIADEVARVADVAFATGYPSLGEAWLGLVAYAVQIYFDFAGYSNMAIGLGLIFGFKFPRNFRVPYRSRSITEFWRRWHISLSSWFRDYLYIPLGGNRHGPVRTYFNLSLVFLLCGLWHGASWTFIIWGLHHGVLLIIERAGLGKRLRALPSVLSRAYTLLAVLIGWVWFRVDDLGHAKRYFAGLIGFNDWQGLTAQMHLTLYPTTVCALALGIFLALKPERVHLLRQTVARLRPHGTAATAALDTLATFSLLLLSLMTVGAGSYSPFLYFRF